MGMYWTKANCSDPPRKLTLSGGARFGYIRIRDGKSHNAKREVSITSRVKARLEARKPEATRLLVFVTVHGQPYLSRLQVRATLKLPSGFVLHSLRHTMLTRLGEAGVDAFTIMKIAGHSSITISSATSIRQPRRWRTRLRSWICNNAGTVHGVGTKVGTAPDEADPEAPATRSV